jgi:hypothetical protein
MIFKRIGRAIFWIIEVCGALLGAAGIVMLYVSWLAWLKTGIWPDYDLQALWIDLHFKLPHTEWLGESLSAVILTLPSWIAFLIVGGVLFILGAVCEGRLDDYAQFAEEAE